ncbi:MAG: UvrD-helicase domain-containing protein [Ndongobacter sp.]|nr:UvrD-helicase domain-containing protein [Ndongobacter sp.]
MSDFRFTEEQQRVLDVRQKNVIVSAQAGAGKTRVLVERILNLVEQEHVPLSEQLIVTFTNKAANEMKDRIRSGLAERAAKAGADRPWMLSQLHCVTSANIQTMHAFSLEILQEFFDRLGRDPGFHILEEQKLTRLRDRAMDELLADCYRENDAATMAFFEAYGFSKRRSDEPLKELIYALYFQAQKQLFPELWLEEQKTRLGSEEEVQELWQYWLQERIVRPLSDMLLLLQRIHELLESPLAPEKYVTFFCEEDQRLKRCLLAEWRPEALAKQPISVQTLRNELCVWAQNRVPELAARLTGVRFERLPAVSKKELSEHGYSEEIMQAVKECRKQIKELVTPMSEHLQEMSLEALRAQNQSLIRPMSCLIELTNRFAGLYQAEKAMENGVDFSDVEHEMVALVGQEEIQQILKRRFRYIFFDEYQDSSAIQDYIVECIRREDNLFFVGDIKQSIYAFRQARPQNFLERYERYQKGAQNCALDLTSNFRSRPAILHFVNFLFDRLMTPELGDVLYATPIHRSVPRLSPEPFAGEVHIALLEEASVQEDEEAVRAHFDEISSEAFYVAHEIQRLVAEGAHFRDCAILFRTKRRMADFESVLQHFGIPYYTDSPSKHTLALEIQLFFQLLRVIDNERQDVPLLAVLSSAAVGLSDEALAAIRIAYPENSFCDALHLYSAEKKDETAKRVCAFLAQLRHFRLLQRQMSLSQFSWQVLLESGLYSFFSGLSNGEERRENLHSVLSWMESLEAEGALSLFDFLQYVQSERRKSEAELPTAAALSEEDDVVRLMTIHKSKGLEFANVFLVELNRAFYSDGRGAALRVHMDGGAALPLIRIDEQTGVSLRKKTLRQLYLEDLIRREQRSEAVRVLYVALTRAMERLFLVGSAKKLDRLLTQSSGRLLQDQFETDNSYMAWIVHRLLYDRVAQQSVSGDLADRLPKVGIEDYYAGWDKEQIGIFFTVSDGERYRNRSAQRVGVSEELKPEEALWNGADIFSFEYAYQSDTKQPIKRTVSEIAQKNRLLDAHYRDWPKWAGFSEVSEEQPALGARSAPRFIQGSVRFSPAEWGSRMHAALQRLPVRPYTAEQMTRALDEFVEDEYMTAEERASLDEQALCAFYGSALGQRIQHATRCERERAFTMRFSDETGESAVDGQIDLFFEEANEWVIVDFKTDRRIHPEDYEVQMAFYLRGLERATGKRVKEVCLYWLHHGTMTSLSTQKLRQVFEQLAAGK